MSMPLEGGRRPRRSFLSKNPYPHPLTEGFFYREKMRAIHAVAPAIRPARVLEVGGGRSGLTGLLYPGAAVTNVDRDDRLAHAPPNRRSGISFVCADATQLPFEDGTFQVVTMFDLLEHVSDDRAAAREALRVLQPGGHLLVTTPSDRWRFPYYRALRPICPTSEEIMARWGHVRRGYSLPALEELFGSPAVAVAGFNGPVTVVAHDISFSRLPAPLRRALCALLAPVTWSGYWARSEVEPGTEIAAAWIRGDGSVSRAQIA